AVARIVADFAGHRGDPGQRAWIAVRSGCRAGSVFCARESDTAARLRLLLVEPAARRHGVGRRLVEECGGFGRDAGSRRIVLSTQDALVTARAIYRAAGFSRTGSSANDSYDPAGRSETWELAL